MRQIRCLVWSAAVAVPLCWSSAEGADPIPCDLTPTIVVSTDDEPMADGPFEPTWESLQQYEVPKWFRDAKFGIWRTGARSASRARRLVRPAHVRSRPLAIRRPPPEVRPSQSEWVQGRDPRVEGRKLGPRRARQTLQAGLGSTSSRWPAITTTSTCGIVSITSGIVSESGRRKISLPNGLPPREPKGCGSASAFIRLMLGRGTNRAKERMARAHWREFPTTES